MLAELYSHNTSTYSYLNTVYRTKSIKGIAILNKYDLIELEEHEVKLSGSGLNLCKNLERLMKTN